jgi:TonB-linked SusC/RagA family outer membrane protein
MIMLKPLPKSVRPLLLTVLLAFLHLPLLAQQITIQGRVTEGSTPLPGVKVILKGSNVGTLTSANGTYSLAAPPTGTLVFSYVGYTSQEIPINGRTSIDVGMSAEARALNEAIVVGYGTQRRAETTGAIASVKAAELTQTPVINVAQGLQARAAGVQITQNSAAPGGNISVRIRGTNSINGTSEPLYVIDGIQINNGGGINDVSPLSTINPNDIESVEVLKDASATAIYGARAANGVILITTKRGQAGATRVTYESYYGVQEATKQISMLNAREFAEMENEVYRTQVHPNPAQLGEGVNWQDLVLRRAPIQNHQLSLSGGSEKTQLALSANYFDQDGIIINSNFKRYSLRLNLDHQLNERFRVGTSIFGSYSINDRIPTGVSSLALPPPASGRGQANGRSRSASRAWRYKGGMECFIWFGIGG